MAFNCKIKIELSDSGYSDKIIAHDIIPVPDDFNFNDYYSIVKHISPELEKYFNENIKSYTRIYVNIYYN